eukprot:6301773-Amphidinium_carterae.1
MHGAAARGRRKRRSDTLKGSRMPKPKAKPKTETPVLKSKKRGADSALEEAHRADESTVKAPRR